LESQARRLAYLGLLVALAVVLTRVASVRIAIMGVEGVRLGFGHFPVILAGILFGPLAGAAAGALADVVGFAVSPMGAYMPHFTFAWALTGALPALALKVFAPNRSPAALGVGRLFAAIAFGQLISSVLLIPYFLELLFALPWEATFPPKIVSEAITIPAYAVLMHLLLRRVAGLIPVRTSLVRSAGGQ